MALLFETIEAGGLFDIQEKGQSINLDPFFLTLQPHQHSNTAFEKAGVRAMSIWEALTKKMPTINVSGKAKEKLNPERELRPGLACWWTYRNFIQTRFYRYGNSKKASIH